MSGRGVGEERQGGVLEVSGRGVGHEGGYMITTPASPTVGR